MYVLLHHRQYRPLGLYNHIVGWGRGRSVSYRFLLHVFSLHQPTGMPPLSLEPPGTIWCHARQVASWWSPRWECSALLVSPRQHQCSTLQRGVQQVRKGTAARSSGQTPCRRTQHQHQLKAKICSTPANSDEFEDFFKDCRDWIGL